ncbi:MAG: hypothetical protein R3F14_42695 [Polyangiaceae bacterium]
MKARHLLSLALTALCAYLLGAGCVQDFDVFKACPLGTKLCGGDCVGTNDPELGCASDNCAPCDLANADATCLAGACAIATCNGNFSNCDSAQDNGCEADVSADPAQCGACGNACVVPHAQAACQSGQCTVGTCDPGWEDCDGEVQNGCEANLDADPDNCGDCGTACPGSQSCQAGKCVLVCPDGTGDCDNNPANGCETNLDTDPDNCGFCGDACDLANASATCAAGACVIDTCNNGFDDCNANDADGCEANLQTSALTCGSCGNACPNAANGTSVCNSGQCAVNCNAGFGNCDNNLQNGCEADLATSNTSCGACGQPCNPQNGTGACTAGACQIQSCNGAFDDCDNNAANGCETNTAVSLQSCGACGQACSFANAAATCNNGTCTMGACAQGFANCNNAAADGCEVNTAQSPTDCGSCGNVCPTAPGSVATCNNGTCSLACDAGFANCDGNMANGCETNIATSVTNCGACGRTCSGNNVAARSCSGGVCDSTCDLGFGNCTMPAAPMNDNGCETNVTASDTSCGGCGNSCSAQGGTNDFECDAGNAAQQYCGCFNANPAQAVAECANAGVDTGTVSCQNAAGEGLCVCSGVTCHPGESCIAAGAQSACSCETAPGGAACGAGETCCVLPAGCKNLQTDPAACGACGRSCAPGFICTAGSCRCDNSADCDGGSAQPISCDVPSGLCLCNVTQCAAGERCLPNGQCG